MTKSTKIKATHKGGATEVKMLMSHNMENGLAKDESGKPVPAHYINEFQVRCNGKTVLEAQLGPSIARNPFMAFSFKGGKPGDTLSVTWKDNLGITRTDETKIS